MRFLAAGLLAFALGLLMPMPVHAAANAPNPEPGTSVEMPFLIAPISVGEKLQGYAYISTKLVATSPSAAIDIRDKLAFIQDAFVRDVNNAPVTKADDPETVDTSALIGRLTADARRIVGAEKVSTMTITQIQVAPLRASQQTNPGPS